ncbi:hypothetical protein D5274_06065 [bacterium 1XD42-94]|nr:hypothetical protein [bacterium 1XD42-76]NBK04741.1 hypothetical protein [bacterium 1XD42-94]
MIFSIIPSVIQNFPRICSSFIGNRPDPYPALACNYDSFTAVSPYFIKKSSANHFQTFCFMLK